MRDDPILVIIVCALMCFPLFVFLKACDSEAGYKAQTHKEMRND